MQGVNVLYSLSALLVVSGAGYLTVFHPEQLSALAMLLLRGHDQGVLAGQVFFGFHCLFLAILLYRSPLFPSVLGVLLAVAGAGYLADSFGNFLAPHLDTALDQLVVIMAVPGELSFTVWLLWKGVRTESALHSLSELTRLRVPASRETWNVRASPSIPHPDRQDPAILPSQAVHSHYGDREGPCDGVAMWGRFQA